MKLQFEKKQSAYILPLICILLGLVTCSMAPAAAESFLLKLILNVLGVALLAAGTYKAHLLASSAVKILTKQSNL